MNKIEPSFKGGMNSDPRRWNTGMVDRPRTKATMMTVLGKRTTKLKTGVYNQNRNLLIGCLSSDRMRPRIRRTPRAGTKVTARMAAKAIENVFV